MMHFDFYESFSFLRKKIIKTARVKRNSYVREDVTCRSHVFEKTRLSHAPFINY